MFELANTGTAARRPRQGGGSENSLRGDPRRILTQPNGEVRSEKCPCQPQAPGSSPLPNMKIGFVSLGCPKNLVDSEVMLGLAREAGHTLTHDAADADVLVVNTCAFIDSAKQESINAILEMAAAQDDRPLPAARRHRVPGGALPRRAAQGNPRGRRDPGDGRGAGHCPGHRRRHVAPRLPLTLHRKHAAACSSGQATSTTTTRRAPSRPRATSRT